MATTLALLEQIISDLSIGSEPLAQTRGPSTEDDSTVPTRHRIDEMEVEFVRKARALNIYDFDGTLFRSPEPSRRLWDNKTLARIMAQPCEGGYGWYQDTLTLSEEVLFTQEGGLDRWWNEQLLPHVHASATDPESVSVLLTGRSTAYTDIIRDLVERSGIAHFDHYFLKPVSLEAGTRPVRTMEFKLDVIRTLVLQYRPEETTLFDDRSHHVERFRQLDAELAGRCMYAVHHVRLDSIRLPVACEVEVVQALARKYRRSEEEEDPSVLPTVMYTGVFLDESSHRALLRAFQPPDEWIVKAHHMTMCLNSLDPAKEPFSSVPERCYALGREAVMRVVGFGKTEQVMAVLVETGVPSRNAIKHVTIAVSPTGKARDSNDIPDWSRFEEGDPRCIVLCGVVSEQVTYSIRQPQKTSRPYKGRGGHKNVSLKINFAALLREAHPSIDGPQIGLAVKIIKEWMKGEEDVTEVLVAAFVREIDLGNLGK